MRLRNRGELLNEKEIKEITNFLRFSNHGLQRLYQRGDSPSLVKQKIINCDYAYFNTDYSINVVLNDFQCYVIVKDCYGFLLVTYKEDTHTSMAKKRKLAIQGIERRG